jgi:hypothetical protein
MDADRMMRMRDMAGRLDPDIIVFTGDQMDRRDADADIFVQGFSGISAPMGVWGVLGNHDHFIDPKRSEWALEAAGIQPLVNSAVTFERSGASLALVGIEDLQARDGRTRKISCVVQNLPLPPTAGLAPGGSCRRPPHTFGPHPRRSDRAHRPQPQRRALQHPLHRGPVSSRRGVPLRLARGRSRRSTRAGRCATGDRSADAAYRSSGREGSGVTASSRARTIFDDTGATPQSGALLARRVRCHFHNCHRRARNGGATMTIVKVAPVSSTPHRAPH